MVQPADFAAPPPNTHGNTGRGILYAPGHVNFDTSLSKRFTVVGRTNAEFRWDAFNLFNHPGFGFPNQDLGAWLWASGSGGTWPGRQRLEPSAQSPAPRAQRREPKVPRAQSPAPEPRRPE